MAVTTRSEVRSTMVWRTCASWLTRPLSAMQGFHVFGAVLLRRGVGGGRNQEAGG